MNRSRWLPAGSQIGALGVLAIIACGCSAAQHAAHFETRDPSTAPPPAHPPAVVVDPLSELPPARASAPAARELVVLHTPADPTLALQVVRDFFEAVVHEKLDDLERLLGSETPLEVGAHSGTQRARAFWRARFAKLDYTRLRPHTIFRDSEVETYRAAEPQAFHRSRGISGEIAGADLLVRVPILAQRLGQTVFFGEQISFLLRPTERGFEIVELREDFDL